MRYICIFLILSFSILGCGDEDGSNAEEDAGFGQDEPGGEFWSNPAGAAAAWQALRVSGGVPAACGRGGAPGGDKG